MGNLFTEIGTVNLKEKIDSVMYSDKATDHDILNIYRNAYWLTMWTKRNYLDFLKHIYATNQKNPEHKINFCPVDIAYDWSKVTTKEEADSAIEVPRDSIMALNTVNYLNRLPPGSKVLIVQNFHHAFSNSELFIGKNFLFYLKQRIDIPIANVFIHNLACDWDETEYTPIQEGRWDAAFTYLGIDNIGFDFKGSPLGEDRFDYVTDKYPLLTYTDVFTGMVYLSPAKMYYGWGFNGSVTPDFMTEMIRRHEILELPSDEETISDWYNTMDDETIANYCPDYDKIIRKQMRRIKDLR